MSKGSGFLLIPAARLTAPEIRNLTAAQQTLYDRLHFALHQKNGCRQGYYSYSDLADLCNLHPSTVIEGIKVLVANNLLLKRNRVDARSIAISAGGRPFLAANGYRLLTPPSLCSDEEKAEIERLRLEWGQAEQVECRAWRRVRERHAPQASAEASAEAWGAWRSRTRRQARHSTCSACPHSKRSLSISAFSSSEQREGGVKRRYPLAARNGRPPAEIAMLRASTRLRLSSRLLATSTLMPSITVLGCKLQRSARSL